MRYRLHLYNGGLTDWFGKEDLTQMMRKYEGRIITIGKEEDGHQEANSNT